MQGMFKANGGCGYVKKPDLLMNNEAIFDPRAMLPVKMTLKVTSNQVSFIYVIFSPISSSVHITPYIRDPQMGLLIDLVFMNMCGSMS